MYDDDKGASSGLGGLAWYQLGRWSAEGEHFDRELAETRRNREGRSPVVVDQSDVDALAANATISIEPLTTITMSSNWQTRKSSRRIRISHS
jgi:hypothetical protein